ncbi:MAG: sigma-54 dependent transcriptional regulator [Planctomycetota bacterium]
MNAALQSVLIVDDDAAHRGMLATVLGDLVSGVHAVASGEDAVDFLGQRSVDLVILDMRMPGWSGLETLRAMAERGINVPTVVLTAHADVDDAVTAMKLGAVDYLRKPVEIATLTDLFARQFGTTESDPDLPPQPEGTVFHSPLMREVLVELSRAAPSGVPVLLHGETGTGKEVLADLLHRWSNRSAGPMVSLNVAALPENLVESELFGHVRGSFTGADRDRTGRIRDAEGGTLFLDEIGEMDLAVQPKLLRVLESGGVTRLGESREEAVDFRLVTATNRRLEEEVASGGFREDLYYRIAVLTIEVPPLRERLEDVLPLARHFLDSADTRGKRLSRSVEALLLRYDWPGNIRELRNAVLRAAILAPGDTVLPENLPPTLRVAVGEDEPAPDRGASLAEIEKQAIFDALDRCDGNRTRAAGQLGISRRKLLYRLKEYRST